MDNAVALVQAYLRINGYFTVTEFQVLASGDDGFHSVTDVDVLAFRFPRTGDHEPRSRQLVREVAFDIDPELAGERSAADMIVGEVKEGVPKLNAAARNPAVLTAVLTRFGCCSPEEAPAAIQALAQKGSAVLPNGHQIRMLVFAPASRGQVKTAYRLVSLGHVVQFLQAHLRDHWEVFRHAQWKDPAFGFLATIEKALRKPE